MSVLFELPDYLPAKKIYWKDANYTFVVGPNGSGKTFLLNKMAEWAEEKNYSYAFYDATTSLSIAPLLMEQASDEDIIYVAKMIMDFSMDFRDDVFNWTKAKNGHTTDQIGPIGKDAKLLREVFSMCGNGYTRMFVMLYFGIQNMGNDYYFLDMPETSLHKHLSRQVINILMKNFPYTKFVISTRSPDIIDIGWTEDTVIEMTEDYVNKCRDFKYDEIFS